MLSILQRCYLFGADPDYYYCDANFLRSDNKDYKEILEGAKKTKTAIGHKLIRVFANGFPSYRPVSARQIQR